MNKLEQVIKLKNKIRSKVYSLLLANHCDLTNSLNYRELYYVQQNKIEELNRKVDYLKKQLKDIENKSFVTEN